MFLVITEKPSVAKEIGRILGADGRKNGYLESRNCVVSWCLGHLAEYASPQHYDTKYENWIFDDLPILPENWQLVVLKDKREQLEILKKLLNRKDMEYVVNACDAGREGELIFKRVYDLSGSTLPVKRLWISSMEDSAIQEGFEHLKDGSALENLCEAAVCRAKADWLIGMNATRAFTTKYYKKLIVGRVQTPTLAMLAERDRQIRNFRKEKYFNVTLDCYGMEAVKEKISEEKEAIRIRDVCSGAKAVVESAVFTEKASSPPKLYDLTTLQRENSRYFGYTAKQTLEYAQSLYEKKLLTYPRTDSQYLTEDMEETARKGIMAVQGLYRVDFDSSDIKRVLDNGKVSDHHAIIPTIELKKCDLHTLSKGEKDTLLLVSMRLLCATGQNHTYVEPEITVSCAGEKFLAKGKQVREKGWKAVEEIFRKLSGIRGKTEEDEEEPGDFSVVREGMVFESVDAEISEHFTSPPKPFSEDTLLSAMENAGRKEFEGNVEKKGLGTPATRAGIIEKLVSSGYAVRKGKQILPTSDGIVLIEILPEYLKSASMTAEWENKLLSIEKGEFDSQSFMDGIKALIKRMLFECSTLSQEEQSRFHPREQIGICPVCGAFVYEGKKNFYCSDRECSFALWKENRYLSGMKKLIDKRMAEDLLRSGQTHVTDFYSQKTGRNFTADLLMEVKDGRVNFSLKFPDKKKKHK
ncbi:MAG: DNA topoisomerase 3 [Blautia sp.]|nr:DNA topoisomerase 3 [Blautia sp.]MDY3998577.1 DNA topoisomerase 3 [Blautia sp.]